MPIIIEGSSKGSLHKSFWNALTKNSDSLALSQLWVCGISLTNLTTVASQVNLLMPRYEPGAWSPDQSGVNSALLQPANWDSVKPGDAGNVYLWTRGASFVGDGLSTSRVGSQQTGAIKGLISENRNEFSTVNITFLESNISFVDGLLRPWSVLVGYRSLKDQTLRCNIELFALEKWDIFSPFKVRKSMLFRNAVPVSIDTEEYNYTGDKLIERQVQFAFDRYESKVYPTISNSADNEWYNAIKATGEILPEYQLEASLRPGKGSPSLVEQLQNILNSAAGIAVRAQGVAADVSAVASQGLNAVGLTGTANQVQAVNTRFQNNIIAPTGRVIGTGQQIANIPGNVQAVTSRVTGTGVNANTVANDIKASAKPQTP